MTPDLSHVQGGKNGKETCEENRRDDKKNNKKKSRLSVEIRNSSREEPHNVNFSPQPPPSFIVARVCVVFFFGNHWIGVERRIPCCDARRPFLAFVPRLFFHLHFLLFIPSCSCSSCCFFFPQPTTASMRSSLTWRTPISCWKGPWSR